MLPWNKTNAAVSVDSACLEETDLRKLFAGGGDPSGQASLVGHLDGCGPLSKPPASACRRQRLLVEGGQEPPRERGG